MRRVSLNVDHRVEVGKGPARRLRAVGKAPAILYGRKMEPVKLALDVRDFTKIMGRSGFNTLFDLQIVDAQGATTTRTALLKERQVRPVDDALIHVDFVEALMDELLEVTVPLHFEGKAIGVEKGGMFQPAAREIRLRCLPSDIPYVINVDVSKLEMGHSIHVGEVTLPEGVSPAMDTTIALATVLAPKKGEEIEEQPSEPAPAAKK
jgi:large subunit ribosomal protein L25